MQSCARLDMLFDRIGSRVAHVVGRHQLGQESDGHELSPQQQTTHAVKYGGSLMQR